MSGLITNQPKSTASAFGYFVLSFCLLIPTVGTFALIILLDRLPNERRTLASAAFVYLSSFVLGLFSTKRFRKYHGRAEFWALMVGIALSGVCGLVATGSLILSNVAAGLHIH